MPEEPITPVERLVELTLLAPLGLALTARDHLPELVARGRKQVDAQLSLARMMGQYAVKQGEKDLRVRMAEVTETLRGLGVLPEPGPVPSTHATPSAPTPAPSSRATTAPSNGHAAVPDASTDAPPATRSQAELAIPGYDTLAASQVVQRLAGLAPDELEAVRAYESGTRGRRTILSKVAQLQSDPST